MEKIPERVLKPTHGVDREFDRFFPDGRGIGSPESSRRIILDPKSVEGEIAARLLNRQRRLELEANREKTGKEMGEIMKVMASGVEK